MTCYRPGSGGWVVSRWSTFQRPTSSRNIVRWRRGDIWNDPQFQIQTLLHRNNPNKGFSDCWSAAKSRVSGFAGPGIEDHPFEMTDKYLYVIPSASQRHDHRPQGMLLYYWIYIYIYLDIYYIYIYRKGLCQVPIFPRFWDYSVFATSCSILSVHIPVMVLLEIHTDCQTSSEVAKGYQRMSRKWWRFPGKRKEEKQT